MDLELDLQSSGTGSRSGHFMDLDPPEIRIFQEGSGAQPDLQPEDPDL